MERHSNQEDSARPAGPDLTGLPSFTQREVGDNRSNRSTNAYSSRFDRRAEYLEERATYSAMIKKFVATNVNGGARLHDAEDAQQTAILGYLRALRNGSENALRVAVSGAEELHAYVGRANTNSMISVYRDNRRLGTISIDSLQENGGEREGFYDGWEPTTNTFEEQLVEAIDVRSDLAEVLADLPDRQRAAARLKLGGSDYVDIAQRLGTTPSAANSLQLRGMKVVWASLGDGAEHAPSR